MSLQFHEHKQGVKGMGSLILILEFVGIAVITFITLLFA